MRFTETPLSGAYLIDIDRQDDERGFFARAWSQEELETHDLNPRIAQCNISFNAKGGTLRGMHYQVYPYAETKLVRCTMGAIFDVIIDLRPRSPTYKHHFCIVLSSENRRMLYVPEGFAHGFQTLEDASEVFYQMSNVYTPGAARGVRWNDPVFGVSWPPAPGRTISERDQQFPDFQD